MPDEPQGADKGLLHLEPGPEFLNVYEAQESIPRIEFRQPM